MIQAGVAGSGMRAIVLGIAFTGAGLFQALLAVGFILRMGWAVDLWPWPVGPLSYIFIGAVLAGLATGSLWVAATQRWRAALPSLVGLCGMFAAMGVYLLGAPLTDAATGAVPHFAAFFATAFGAAVLITLAMDEPGPIRPLAPLVRASCVVFALALLGAGIALVSGAGQVLPWPVSGPTATMFGLTFIGLSSVHALTAWWADRDMAVVAMAGFLVYDAVLLPAFYLTFQVVPEGHLPSLSVYVAVLVYSALLALWFLFLERPARARKA